MIEGKKVLGLIPARGGSKGVPGKNIRQLCGKPLIAWSIEAAKRSRILDHVVLSSDDPAIIEIARTYGCDVPFVRPDELATDEARTIDVVLHAIENLSDFDVVVVLQPTSPLRTEDDIDDCIAYCVERHANSCVSVTEASESPYWMFSLDRDGKLSPMLDQGHLPARRQDLPHCYSLNGAIYVAFVPWIRRSKTFVDSETLGWAMPRERSIDIDTEQDIQFLTFLLGKYRND